MTNQEAMERKRRDSRSSDVGYTRHVLTWHVERWFDVDSLTCVRELNIIIYDVHMHCNQWRTLNLTSSVDRTLAEVNLRRAYRPTTHIRVRYVVATRTDFLVRGVVRASRMRKSDTSNDTDDMSDNASNFVALMTFWWASFGADR